MNSTTCFVVGLSSDVSLIPSLSASSAALCSPTHSYKFHLSSSSFTRNLVISPISSSSTSSSSSSSSRSNSKPALTAKLDAILFDCDGVLADTERDAHRIAFNMAFQEQGLSCEWDEQLYGHLLETGGGKERMTVYFNQHNNWPPQCTTPEKKQELVQSLHLLKTTLFNKVIESGKVPLRPGIQRIIDEAIAQGIPNLAICSTSNDKAVTFLAQTLFGPTRFPKFKIFAGDIVKNKKPSPDIYNLAVDTMGLDKANIIVIEDSKIGLQAAKAAGLKCLVTKSTYTVNEDFSTADMVVDDLDKGNVTMETLKALVN